MELYFILKQDNEYHTLKTLFNIAIEKCNESKLEMSNEIFDNNLENLSYFKENVDEYLSEAREIVNDLSKI